MCFFVFLCSVKCVHEPLWFQELYCAGSVPILYNGSKMLTQPSHTKGFSAMKVLHETQTWIQLHERKKNTVCRRYWLPFPFCFISPSPLKRGASRNEQKGHSGRGKLSEIIHCSFMSSYLTSKKGWADFHQFSLVTSDSLPHNLCHSWT